MPRNPIVIATLFLSVAALFVEQLLRIVDAPLLALLVGIIDYAILLSLMIELAIDYHRARYKRVYLKQSIGSLAFAAVFVGFFVFSKVSAALSVGDELGSLPNAVIIIRNLFLVLRIFGRLRRLSAFLEEISTHPAQTILVSFLVVILVGALLLMMPFTDPEGQGLDFIDALFTATSAVCVTGLIVVDTSAAFTLYGQIIILVLIQIGGLGIMLLSYFTVFVFRRTISIEDKMLISFMLSEKDMTKLAKSLMNIMYTTLVIEAVGAIVLGFGIGPRIDGTIGATVFFAVFHSISAFCNAGFSLFSDSMERFRSVPSVVLPLSLLIIAGGISFAVIADLRRSVFGHIRRLISRQIVRVERISLNTQSVLVMTGSLLLLGMLAIYGLEYRNEFATDRLSGQYLSAFFQSVTLRTAGFNTVPFSKLMPSTYLVMAVFMFVGGASGSTAGGIKVNTIAVMLTYVRATLRDRETAVLYRHSIPTKTVTRAFLILLFGISAVVVGTILLSLFESAPLEHVFFEVVSAFGTVGLSAGLTGSLSVGGKLVIIALMFMGRLGPLTILAAASGSSSVKIEYPRGEIAVG